jgi:phage tail tape-measure protein
MQGIEIPIGAPLGQLGKDIKGAEKKLKGFTNSASTDLKSFSSNASSAFKTAGLAIAGAFSVGAFISFGKEVLAVTAEFEKFNAVLGNTLGSNALAKLKLKEIEDFAAKTPFGVKELTDSFIKLANQGFKPTGDQMRSLGDLAASTGKSFNQLAEAILDAQTGEFERLKEFGIRAQDAGDKVIFTFKGVQTTVDKSSEAIRGYVTSLGSAEGVSGSMAVISETLTGKISNLGDSWDSMLVSVGSNTSGVFTSAINLISQAINKVTDFNKSLNTVSKFKLESDWGEKLNRAINPFAEKGSTSTEKAIYAIKQADIEVTKFVSGALAGAKSTSDFGTAIADLQKKGNAMIADFKMFAPQGLAGIKTTYEDGIKALKEGRTAFENELKKGTPTKINLAAEKKAAAEAAKLAKESAKTQAEIRVQAQAFAGKLVIDGFTRNIEAEKLAIEKEFAGLDALIEETNPFAKLFAKQDLANVQSLLTPFQNLKLVLQSEILPQLSTSFKTFFDDLLMNGKLSFESLGQAIKNTFLSVLASEATKGVVSLLSSGSKEDKKGVTPLISGIGTLLGIGKKVAPVAKAAPTIASIAATTGGFLGTGAALSGGTAATLAPVAATGGALLPILAGVAAIAGIASLFKKKKQAPIPQASSTISTSAAGSAQDFGGGRVVFEISGTNLIGVLNRAGAKLQRFGP